MAKQRNQQESKAEISKPVPAPQAPRSAPPAAEIPPVYSFETKPRCPRCGGVDSRCYATKNGVQYRVCRMVVCRVAFSVRGAKVK